MEKAEGRNRTLISEFILLGLGNGPELQPLLFLVFLVIYIMTLAGNTLIIALVVADRHLHTPMYYLLGNLACLEICYSSTFQPRLLASLLTGDRTISVKGCLVQLYFFGCLSSLENLLLAAMSYDRYVAICQPLRYATLMNSRVCCQLLAGAWIASVLNPIPSHSFFINSTFCDSKEIDHFFCDYFPLIKLSCGDTRTQQIIALTAAAIFTIVPCLLTVMSYICIIAAILRIPSTTGRQKAFSTCSSHLIVITIFYVTVITLYIFPTANTSKVLSKIVSIFYTVLTPLINPVIYCLRNKEVKEYVRKMICHTVAFRNRSPKDTM